MEEIIKKIKEIEAKTGRTCIFVYGASKKIALDTSKSSLNKFGVIDFDNIETCLSDERNLPRLKQDGCDLIICSPGGSLACAIGLMKVLFDKFGTVNVIVPSHALSCATLISFGATRLFVEKTSKMSDFMNIRNPIALKNIQSLTSRIEEHLKNGEIVPAGEEDKFLMLNSMISKTVEHEKPFNFFLIKEIYSNLDIDLNIKELDQVDFIDPDFMVSGVANSYREVHKDIMKLMKDNSYAKVVLVSDFSNLAVI